MNDEKRNGISNGALSFASHLIKIILQNNLKYYYLLFFYFCIRKYTFSARKCSVMESICGYFVLHEQRWGKEGTYSRLNKLDLTRQKRGKT